MKKVLITILVIVIIVAGIWGYFAYKKNTVEDAVHEYLLENGTVESDIVSLDPFMANLQGNKNYMVEVKLKDDDKTYYYYRNDDNKVILESYIENGEEFVQ